MKEKGKKYSHGPPDKDGASDMFQNRPVGCWQATHICSENDEWAEHSASEFTLSYFESCHQNLVIFYLLNFLPMFLPLQQHAACQKSLETPSSFLHEQDYPLANPLHHPNQTYDQNHCQSLSC
jgi:hypothetical protein